MTFITAGLIETIRTLKDGSLSFTVSTQELDGDRAADLFKLRQKAIVVALSEKGFSKDALEEIDKAEIEIPKKEGKSQSQRLRAVFFRLWEQDSRGMTKEQHYDFMMEMVIEHYKGKLE